MMGAGGSSIGVRAATLLAMAAVSAPAAAQEINPCLIPPPPFALTEANRLGDAELRQLFVGRTNEHVRKPNPAAFADRRQGPPWTERYLSIEWRTDGSFFYRCEELRQGSGALLPCQAGGPRGAGASDIGIWRVVNRALCYTFSWAGPGSERCISVHRHNERYVGRSVSGGWTCVEGEIHFK